MFCGKPQLTEEKLVATLKLGQLMHEGIEEVVWRNFVTNFWKIIDEVNRLNPYVQDILLSLLAEGTVKYYDSVVNISKFTLYGTINPQDVGTFELRLFTSKILAKWDLPFLTDLEFQFQFQCLPLPIYN
ncbi:MAG: AAA family ATPase [Candidatus Thorarchaeota archaeon]